MLIVVLQLINNTKISGLKKRLSSKNFPISRKIQTETIQKTFFREDTGIALATRSKFIRKGERIGKKVKCIQYDDPFYSFDLNTKKDLRIIRKIYQT